MKRQIVVGFIVICAVGLLTLPALVSAAPLRAGSITILLEFQSINQGQIGVIRAAGTGIAEVRAVFQERLTYFYPAKSSFVGLIAADIEQDPGDYTLQVWVKYADDTTERVDKTVTVNNGGFGRSDITLPASLSPLLDPAINDAEMDRLFNIMNRFTPERYWAGGFILPSTEPLVAWFGTYRLYNGAYWYRHTGIDVRVPVGTSVAAPASGRIMLAQALPIRGNYILIDHGWGIYSGLAHLSEMFVLPGQWVRQGDIIGLSGMTGRTSGAHIHWEMVLDGTWVDPETLMSLGLDAASGS